MLECSDTVFRLLTVIGKVEDTFVEDCFWLCVGVVVFCNVVCIGVLINYIILFFDE